MTTGKREDGPQRPDHISRITGAHETTEATNVAFELDMSLLVSQQLIEVLEDTFLNGRSPTPPGSSINSIIASNNDLVRRDARAEVINYLRSFLTQEPQIREHY